MAERLCPHNHNIRPNSQKTKDRRGRSPVFFFGIGLVRQSGKESELLFRPGVEGVGFSRHDKVIAMQTLDLVRPPVHPHPTPFGLKQGMMVFLLGQLSDAHGKIQRLPKIPEFKSAHQAGDALHGVYHPVRDLHQELLGLLLRNRGITAPAGDTLQFNQFFHRESPKKPDLFGGKFVNIPQQGRKDQAKPNPISR